MNLNEYFDPVSLDQPQIQFLPLENTFAAQISKHTPDQPLKNPGDFRLALLGLPEDRHSQNSGCAKAPDKIRQHLYLLSKISSKIPILDLGNLKRGKNPVDTYYGLREVVSYLLDKGTCPVFIGGTQDLSYGIYLAYKDLGKKPSLVTIDSRLDFASFSQRIDSDNYLQEILFEDESDVFHYVNLGHQGYFLSQNQLDLLHKHHYETIGVGQIRSELKDVEPFLRDADMVGIDISAVKQSDAPGFFFPSPNGFYSEEICQLAKYAGASNRISSFGVFETNPTMDINNQTSLLAAQIIWYFIEGFSRRTEEFPSDKSSDFTKYMVGMSDPEHTLVFYKSNHTDRWWVEVPVLGKQQAGKVLIACSYGDYLKAGRQEIPERWLKIYQKLN